MRLAVALAVALLPGAGFAGCSEGRLALRGDWGLARFRVEVVDTVESRAQGLMHVEEMAANAGMLFVYERPQSVSFWMENTLIPLDMIFMDATGTVTHIHENAVPHDRTPIPGGSDEVQFVLEVNGGMAAMMGIAEGSQMQHPSVDQAGAVWACDG